MTISLGVLGYIFHLSGDRGGLANLAVITLMVYVASFAISLGPVFWLLISEIYPTKVRGLAAGIASGANWTSKFVVSLTFLTLVQQLGSSWTFWLYGLLSLSAWFFSYYLVRRRKGALSKRSRISGARSSAWLGQSVGGITGSDLHVGSRGE
jgi:nitrate/nitrite transporter NarK